MFAMRLAGDDPTKLEEVYKMNFVGCLNIMSLWYARDRQIEEENRQRELALKNNQ